MAMRGQWMCFGEHSCKASEWWSRKDYTESSGAVIKIIVRPDEVPKAGQSTLVLVTISVVEGTRNKLVLDQLPKLRFKCLPLVNTWVYRREEWGWTRAEVGGVRWESSSRCVNLSLACMIRSMRLLSQAFPAEGWIPGTLPAWGIPLFTGVQTWKGSLFFLIFLSLCCSLLNTKSWKLIKRKSHIPL